MSLEDMFRAYDVRGRYGEELTEETMEQIGKAYGSELQREHKETTTIVGHDVRESSPELHAAFIRGVRATGVDVVDTGFTPYGPVLFYGWSEGLPSAYITASHLGPEWNGVKFAHGTGIGYTEEENMAVKDRFFSEEFIAGSGTMEEHNPLGAYKTHLLDAVHTDQIAVLMDCGNGSSTVAAPELFEAADIAVDVINGEPDGTFPNRGSDVTDDTLETLKTEMRHKDYDMGVAYDGDADRLAVVDDTGRLLSSEQLAYVLLEKILAEQDGPVVANVECSRMLEHIAEQHDREVIRVRVGHTYLFKAMAEHGACFGVEKSGHMGVPHVLPLDDGIATSLYAAAVVADADRSLSELVDAIPTYHRGRFAYAVPDSEKFAVIERLQERLSAEYDRTNTLDGIRIDLADGWVLIRASNTSPKIRLTIEAETEDAFDRLKEGFSTLLEENV